MLPQKNDSQYRLLSEAYINLTQEEDQYLAEVNTQNQDIWIWVVEDKAELKVN